MIKLASSSEGAKALTFSYKVFGNDLSGTFSQLNSRHANFNGGNIFMYVVNHNPDPGEVEYPAKGLACVNGRPGPRGPAEMGVSQLGHHG